MNQNRMQFRTFAGLALLLVSLGIVRSAITTRLDGFTIDEAYHIAAGVSYVRQGDFRINPEHPPLVKLWVGSVIAATGFRMGPLRKFTDKPDERDFTEGSVFRQNDPDLVQSRARSAMFALNGLLLIAVAFALERAFDARVALGTLSFLIIDPTVAAHWPVVMTDLPVALLSTTAIALATRAFRDWKWTDLAACSFFLGLDLGVKHSAPVVVLSVALIGAWMAFRQPSASADTERIRVLKVVAVVAGALAILWSLYFFRYSETRDGKESFNRALVDKIGDVKTPFYHAALTGMAATHMVPRAYLWGFADTIIAGMEGRPNNQVFMGRTYYRKGPKYFFPVMIVTKLPIGLLVLIVLGLGLFFARRIPPEWNAAAACILTTAGLFLLVLMRGATYAGIRHALPVVVMLAVFAGLFLERALVWPSWTWKTAAVAAYAWAAFSAIPVVRPWEYHNIFAGGTQNAHWYFDDEGVDLGQRTKELVAYYQRVVKPRGEVPEILYWSPEQELKGRGVDFLGRDMARDADKLADPERPLTIFARALPAPAYPYFDYGSLRDATPEARFGNLVVYHGRFRLPGLAAGALYDWAMEKIYTDKPEWDLAEKFLRRSEEIDPSTFFVHIDLGNVLLRRGARDEALQEYTEALKSAPDDRPIRQSIEEQIARVKKQPSGEIPPLRDPRME